MSATPTITKTLLTIAVFVSAIANGQPGWEWAKSLSSPNLDAGYKIVNDSSDNFYVAGIFDSKKLLAKFDGQGNLEWTFNEDQGAIYDVLHDGNQHLYSVGHNQLLAKYSLNGQKLWDLPINAQTTSIAIDNNGFLYVAGNFFNDIAIGQDTLYAENINKSFLVKLDSEGIPYWHKKFTGTYISSIDIDASNNIYFTGSFNDTFNFGSLQLVSKGNTDILIAKISYDGNEVWAKQAGSDQTGNSSQYDRGFDLAIDGNNALYVTGSFIGTAFFDFQEVTSSSGGNNMFLAKYNLDGDLNWVVRAGGNHDDEGRTVKLDKNGDVWVGGSFVGPSYFGNVTVQGKGNYDAFVAKYSSDGQALGVLTASGPQWNEFVHSITVTTSGKIVATGSFSSITNFGNIQLQNTSTDIFISLSDMDFNMGIPSLPEKPAPVVFPNPAKDLINISLKIHDGSSSNYTIHDLSGKILLKGTFEGQNEQIDIGHLNQGIYFITITNGQNTSKHKLVKY